MATMYRRRGVAADVVEPWFLLSRSAYQRILDVALADMTSAEVLQRACASSLRGSELLRLLSAGDDVTNSPVDDELMTSTGEAEVRRSRCSQVDDMDTKPLSLVVNEAHRHSWSTGHVTKTPQPLCLRVPTYRRSRDVLAAKRQRPVTDSVCRMSSDNTGHRGNVISGTIQSVNTLDEGDSCDNAEDDASLTSQQTVDKSSERVYRNDLTRKRKSPEDGRLVDANDGDGWAPIDKDLLVGIVERLSVSCLQPTSWSSSVQTTTASTSEFRQPLTSLRRPEPAGRTGAPMKRAAIAPQPWTSRSDVRAPERLRTWSPLAAIVHGSERRKSSVQRRRVQVRDTWNVPADKSLRGVSSKSSMSSASRQLDSASRHVWAPLEKSVVLSVIDHILVDDNGDEDLGNYRDSTTSRRCEQSSRRRWLQPPSLRAITGNPTSSDTGSATAAAEASFKWKSNILRRMLKEQTVVTTSGAGRWLDATPGVVAATGS